MTIHTNQRAKSERRKFSCKLALGAAGLALSLAATATTTDQALRIHDRLTGNIPSENILNQMVTLIDAGNSYDAARLAIDNDEDHSFYNVTLKNWAAPWTNRDFDVFADLNDYISTVIGFVRDNDEMDFRGVLYEDVLYVGPDSLSNPYRADDNDHYTELESELEINGDPGYSLKDDLQRRVQSSVNPELAGGGASGVVTSRAGAKAFLIAGTNRAAFRFTMLNHLCLDMEQVHDIARPSDRIRQDVSRSPGGDSSIFLNSCIGCHSGMDPMTQALAFHHYAVPDRDNDPTGEDGQIEYTPGTVQPKYFNNNATFPAGFITPDNRWANYWREGKNTALGWDETLPGSGTGASSMFQELAHSQAFAQCHIQRVFKTVCLRDPADADDISEINAMVSDFTSAGNPVAGDMKHVFARSADFCKE